MRKPHKIMPQQTDELNKRLGELWILIPSGWKLFVTNTDRGRCCQENKNITVPLWAFEAKQPGHCKHKGDPDFAIYYACHELAHISNSRLHDAKFMETFKRICPARLWHFEIGYKPRNAKAAGITL